VKNAGRHGQALCAFLITFRGAQRCPVGSDTVFNSRAAYRGSVVGYGFRNTVEHQANTHARSEQHRKPPNVGEVGCGLGTTDSYLGQRRENQDNAQDHEDIGCEQENPAQVRCEVIEDALKDGLNLVLQRQRNDDEEEYGNGRDGKHLAMQVDLNTADAPGVVVLTNLIIRIDQIGRTLRGRDAFDALAAVIRLFGSFVAIRKDSGLRILTLIRSQKVGLRGAPGRSMRWFPWLRGSRWRA